MNKYYVSISYSLIDTDTENDDSGLVAGVDEQLAIRRVGGFDSEKIVFSTGVEIIDGLTVDYLLIVVAGIDNEQLIRGGYTVHDVSAKYQMYSDPPLTLYLAINNLTDKYYANHSTIERQGEYRRDIGRDIRFSLKYEF
ncbi:TonB-dependent receptor [Rheinheimera sp. UJ63]|uniref:TonB-dependent receptor n=1 Tax=Rheinheimera sp. UJ63 TaxID=2910157 RepID=UPI001F197D6C|nr:TonB-dependent receptor [Rheinheimera sp. UJ63]MCF4010603.1 TonB-dependent receptor [Rheinheimera sp. UJ63]